MNLEKKRTTQYAKYLGVIPTHVCLAGADVLPPDQTLVRLQL